MEVVAHVMRDVADLVPGFLENKRRELAEIKVALQAEDFRSVEFLGERMYAAGAPFGFLEMTTFGSALRKAAQLANKKSIRQTLSAYEEYLAKVRWKLVDPPTLDSIWRRRREEMRDDYSVVEGMEPSGRSVVRNLSLPQQKSTEPGSTSAILASAAQ